ncbi:glycosyltransferase family 4 protein [Reichenbachiella carrageenanivorans]|uniref:Glycosyltransferase family 4 protein n=1 Tax=Reichenbachiella carrageenanivorans TaxID=2979869 RepID=A0ABY6D560_9BACT|nr:glycosyltransferase family 4 protein [Reichenbachiella carrageenanivorans]UXX81233.1 glycosyltransferase family 4 protein [Reichenbachiella carrageenanivorans]
MEQKKILVITYYWPPSGGGGVQRWLKFVKYLPEQGWEPIVFTPENPEFDLQDESLLKDVNPAVEIIKFPIWEPLSFYKKIFKKKGKLKQGIVIEKTKMSLVDKLSVWVRANLFIPDPRRFWVRPSVEFLLPLIEQHQIDVVVTTGPPHSMHLIGLELKKKSTVRWVADFRDPWSDWDLLDKLGVGGLARNLHLRQELSVLTQADLVLTASQGISKSLAEKYPACNIEVITNGFDTDDFKEVKTDGVPTKFRITHLGLLNELRNPQVLWDCLEEICQEVPSFQDDLELVLSGMVSQSVLDGIYDSPQLKDALTHLDYISHQEVLEYYQQSAVLLLLLNQSDEAQLIIPGKLFEYLMTKKTILAIGKEKSEVNDILMDTTAGRVYESTDRAGVKALILDNYMQFKKGEISHFPKSIDQYTRKALTQRLVEQLNILVR